MTWARFEQDFVERAPLDPGDKALLLARLRGIYGEEPTRIDEARKFMMSRCEPINATPHDALKDHLGLVRLLDFLKNCLANSWGRS